MRPARPDQIEAGKAEPCIRDTVQIRLQPRERPRATDSNASASLSAHPGSGAPLGRHGNPDRHSVRPLPCRNCEIPRIDDVDMLRAGGTPRVFDEVYAPSTLGIFLREFSFGRWCWS